MDENKEIGIKFEVEQGSESAINNLAKKLDEINDSIKDISKTSEKTENTMKNVAEETSKAFSKSNVASFTKAINQSISAIKSLAKYTSKASEYLENLNLFEVAFGFTTDKANTEALKFVNTLSEMYGLDESWAIRTTGIFRQLANAMGVGVETGEKLSFLLTQMSLDISSLYNVDIDRASSTLQSALAGQTKPIRSVAGADITQATLQTTLDTLGIDKAVSQLGYAEKRLLIVISLTDQLSEAINDMGKTIESPANQTRIFHEQWERLTRVVGQMFLPILAKILPYVNAILMVLTEIIDYISRLLGFSEEEFDYINKTGDAFGGLVDGIDQATESSDKLNKSLSGLRKFDKLNVIKTPTESGGTGSVGGGVGGIDKRLLDAFDSAFDAYNRKLEKVQMKATKIRDAVMKWLGFTKLIDEETGKVSFKFDHITSGTVLGALAVGGVIYSGIKGILGMMKKMGLLNFLPSFADLPILFEKILTPLALVKKAITSIASGAMGIGEAFSVYVAPIIETIVVPLMGIVAIIAGLIRSFEGIINFNKDFYNKTIAVEKILEGIAIIVAGIALLLGGWTVAIGAGVVALGLFLAEYITTSKKGTKEISSQTEKAYSKIKKSLDDVTKDYAKLRINKNMILDEKSATEIKENLSSLTKEISDNIKGAKNQLITDIDSMVKSGYLTPTEREEAVKKTEEYYNDIQTKTDEAQNKINKILETASKEKRKLTDEERDEISKAYDTIQKNTVSSLTTSEQEQKVIMQKIKDNNIGASKETASEIIKQAIKTKDEAIQKANEQYDGTLLQAQKMLEVGAINEEQYNKIAEDAKISKDKTVKEAEETYDGVWDEFTKSNEDIADYIDKDSGKVKSNWTLFWEGIGKKTNETWEGIKSDWHDFWTGIDWYIEEKKKKFKEKYGKYFTKEYWEEQWKNIKKGWNEGLESVKEKISEKWGEIKTWWDKNVGKYFTKEYWEKKFDFSSIKIKTPHLEWNESGSKAKGLIKEVLEALSLPTTLPKLNVSWYANGGLPPVGQLFVANEKGPELVGQIGGQSFVANQNQMMNLLESKLGSVQNSKPQIYNIYVGAEKVTQVVYDGLKDMARTNGKPIEIKG